MKLKYCGSMTKLAKATNEQNMNLVVLSEVKHHLNKNNINENEMLTETKVKVIVKEN